LAQKIIVTHISPDFDGIPAIWLLKRYHPEFSDARVEFVPAGDNTLNREPVDSDADIVHVDVGGGRFDHHHSDKFTSGAQLVYEWLVDEGYIDKEDNAIARMVKVITELDHGWDTYKWCEPSNDRYEFSLHNVLSGIKGVYKGDYLKAIDWTLDSLDAVYRLMRSKVKAEEEIKDGQKFKTKWGKGVAVYTGNDSIMDVAIKGGYAVVVRKDPRRGFMRVTGSNKHKVDLTKAYETIVARDKVGTWFLHASKVLLRNGSSRNPTMTPTKLEIDEVVKILEKS